MRTKVFRIEAVAGLVTGVVLERGGFAGIQDVFDHFYPGIFTVGCCEMKDPATEEIYRQCPALRTFVDENPAPVGQPDALTEYVSRLRAAFGEIVELSGPILAGAAT